MILAKFKIGNYKCLYNPGWINTKNPTVLIGCNDGGKSATVEAISYFFDNRMPEEDSYSYIPDSSPDSEGNRPKVKEIILEALFSIRPDEKVVIQQISPIESDYLQFKKTFNREDSTSIFEVKLLVPKDEEIPHDIESLHINTIRELLKQHSIDNPGGNAKEPLVKALQDWVIKQPMEEKWVACPQTIIDMFPIFQEVRGEDPEATIYQILNVTYRQLLKEVETLELLRTFREGIDKLLRKPLLEKTKGLAEHIRNYLPDIVEATAEPQFQISPRFESASLILVGRENAKIDLSNRGAGTRQQVNLSVFQWSSEMIQSESEDDIAHTILAFDEPDLHLDYEAQKRIYEVIEQYVNKGIQVIVATHSINLINRVPLECIHCYSKQSSQLESKIECFAPKTDDQEEENLFIDKLGQVMGFDNATILYESCFLAFEGTTEQSALPILFKTYTGETLIRKGIRLVNCYNDYGAIVFAKFLNRNKRPVLFMVDEDTTWNKGVKRQLTKSKLESAGFDIATQVNIVEPSCFEFSFSNEVWAKVLNINQPEKVKTWLPDEIESYRKSGARNFVREMSNILQEESKPEVGRMIARTVTVPDDIPISIRRSFDNAMAKVS